MKTLFGAHAQVTIGVLCFIGGAVAWLWFIFNPPTVAAVFHVSMAFGLVACYAIIATGLGYRKTEHVESAVAEIENAEEVDVG